MLRGARYEVVVVSDQSRSAPAGRATASVRLVRDRIGDAADEGDELACQLHGADSDTKILYFTGFSDTLYSEEATRWEDRKSVV